MSIKNVWAEVVFKQFHTRYAINFNSLLYVGPITGKCRKKIKTGGTIV